jgi:hypothetical protein
MERRSDEATCGDGILSAENVTPAEIHRRLQAVYGENTTLN